MSETEALTDGRKARGARTRASILEVAANLASVEGLEGLTIGRLATELKMSKSGLFAHFGSKEELQLATVEAAREIFAREVVEPARAAAKRASGRFALAQWFLVTARIAACKKPCVYRASLSSYYLAFALCLSFTRLADGRPPEAPMRAEAQKLSDDIEEAIALLRRSL